MSATVRTAIEGRAGYPLRIAAEYAHLQPRTVRRWTQGYNYTTQSGQRRRSQPIQYLARQAEQPDDKVLDFEQLLTLLLVKAFCDKGLALPTIKKAALKAREFYNLENPFISKDFRSDGNRIFIDLEVPGKERQMIDILMDQRQFRDIVEPSLFEAVVFVGDKAGEWWPLGRDRRIVVAPGRQFGAPHVAGKGTRTDVVAQAFAAEGGHDEAEAMVAEWFGLTRGEVKDAVYFEGEWLRQPG